MFARSIPIESVPRARQDCRLLFEGVSEPWYSKTDRQLCLNIARESIYAYVDKFYRSLTVSFFHFIHFFPFFSFPPCFLLYFYYIVGTYRNGRMDRSIRAEKDKL